MSSFYIKTTKCYNLDAYQAKESKRKKVNLTVYRPDYRKYFSPEILYPIKDLHHRPPQKERRKNQKNPEKIPSKGHPRARTLVEFKEKFPDQFFTTCK